MRRFLSFPLALAAQILTGRCMEPGEYATFATAYVVVTAVGLVSEGGMGAALLAGEADPKPREYAAAFSYQFISGLAVGAGLFLASPWLARVFPGLTGIAGVIRWLSPLPVLLSCITVPYVRNERELKLPAAARATQLCQLAERLALIALIIEGYGALAFVFSRLFGAALQAAALRKLVPWSPGKLLGEAGKSVLRGKIHLRGGFALQLRRLPALAVTGVIPLISGRLFPADISGMMSWSHQTATLISQPLPQYLARKTGRRDLPPASIERLILASTALLATFLAILAAVFPETLRYLGFRPAWLSAGPYFALSCVIMAESVLLLVFDSMVRGREMLRAAALANGAWGIALACVCFVFGYAAGPIGLLWGYILATGIPLLIYHARLLESGSVRVFRPYTTPVLISALIGFAALLCKGFFVESAITLVEFAAAAFAGGILFQLVSHLDLYASIKLLIQSRRASS